MKVIHSLKESDIAILQLNEKIKGYPPMKLASNYEAQRGEEVYGYGYDSQKDTDIATFYEEDVRIKSDVSSCF